jgi:hypothetical protein
MTVTRSQLRKPVPLNAKGHPTVGMLRPRPAPKLVVNPYISQCDSLKNTAEMFEMITEMTNYVIERAKRDSANYDNWTDEIFRKLFDFVDRDMEPTFDEIDAMLLVCNILLERKMKDEMTEFILNCPSKFLLTYANNSERSPAVFTKLRSLGLENICNYLLPYVHYTKLGTWNERRNTHVRGNVSFECSYLYPN